MTEVQRDEAGRRSMWDMIKSCSGTERDRQNQYRFVVWLFGWSITFVLAAQLLKRDPGLAPWLKWAVAILPSAIGIGVVRSYLRFLRMADELMRKVQLDGLAIGFGAGVLFVAGYPLLVGAGAPRLDMSDTMLVMMVAWAFGQLLSMRRYR